MSRAVVLALALLAFAAPARAEGRRVEGFVVRLDHASRTLSVRDSAGVVWNFALDRDSEVDLKVIRPGIRVVVESGMATPVVGPDVPFRIRKGDRVTPSARGIPGSPDLSSRAGEPDGRAWGRILDPRPGTRWIFVVPEHGTFVEGAEVSLYEKSAAVCTGVVQRVSEEWTRVNLAESCLERTIDRSSVLVTMNATGFEALMARVAREARLLGRATERRKGGAAARVGTIRVLPAGHEGLSVSFEILDSDGRQVAVDGAASVTISPAGGGEVLCRVKYDVAKADFVPHPDGTTYPPGFGRAYRTGTIHFYGFFAPPPRGAGARGRLELHFRCADGTLLVGETEFPFDPGDSPGK